MMFSPISLKTKTLETFLVCNHHGDAQEVRHTKKEMINHTGFTSHRLSPKKDFFFISSGVSEKLLQHVATLKQVQFEMAALEYNLRALL